MKLTTKQRYQVIFALEDALRELARARDVIMEVTGEDVNPKTVTRLQEIYELKLAFQFATSIDLTREDKHETQ